METTFSVIVSYYEDTEYVDLAESQDREAMHALAALIASHAQAEICGVWVVGNDFTSEQAYCVCGARNGCPEADRTP